ncbi:hypothetical protein Tco_1279269, partial [Tanacetum coccineum]
TVNPTIYTSCIEQFWETAKANTVNGERQIQALVDKNKVIITESNIRSDLHLEDAGGTDCLPTATIFEELARIGAKSTAWNEFSSTMASLIICLAINQKFNLSKYIFDAMVKRLDGGDFSGRITPLFATMMVQPTQDEGVDSRIPADSLQTPITTQPSSSRSQKKQSRRKQRKDTEVTQEETQQDDSVPTPSNDPPLSEKAKDAQSKEIADLKKRVQKLEWKKKSRTTGLKRLRKVGMSRRVESYEDKDSLGDHEDASNQGRSIEDTDKDADVSLVDDTQGRSDNEEMFDINDLYSDEINVDMPVGEKQQQSAKEREVDTSLEDNATPTTIEEITLAQTLIQIKAAKPKVVTTAATTTTTTRPKARGAVVQEPNQVALDEDLARNLQSQLEAELIEEERLARKQEEEANIALIDKKEIEESSKGTEDELKSDKSKKAESSEEKAKGRRKKILGKKRAGKEQQQESSKRQRIEDDKETDEHEEVKADDEAELKKHLVIVKDDDIAIDAIPLATKPLVIVELQGFFKIRLMAPESN